MTTTRIQLHGGRLDGVERTTPLDADGVPAERVELQHTDQGVWYIEYRRDRRSEDGWHFIATGIEERADED